MNYKDFVKIDKITKNQCLELKEVRGEESYKGFKLRQVKLLLDNDPNTFKKFIKDTLHELIAITR